MVDCIDVEKIEPSALHILAESQVIEVVDRFSSLSQRKKETENDEKDRFIYISVLSKFSIEDHCFIRQGKRRRESLIIPLSRIVMVLVSFRMVIIISKRMKQTLEK